MNRFKHPPTQPVTVKKGKKLAELLENMAHAGFQGRSLGQAFLTWKEMLQDQVTIFFGLSGAMVPAGMRPLIVTLIENRFVDCIVSTGANLFHNIYESFGYLHWMGHPAMNDTELFKSGLDRMYDVLGSEQLMRRVDEWVAHVTATFPNQHLYTTREYLWKLGEEIAKQKKIKAEILSTAVKHGVPVYSGALGDSSIGIAIAEGRVRFKLPTVNFDIIKDIIETTDMCRHSEKTGVIYVGGGTSKNFIQQAQASIPIFGFEPKGHEYAIQITTDAPHWGGLSGCTFEEAESWGKIAEKAKKVTVYADTTLALPIILQALIDSGVKRRYVPQFKFRGDGTVSLKYQRNS